MREVYSRNAYVMYVLTTTTEAVFEQYSLIRHQFGPHCEQLERFFQNAVTGPSLPEPEIPDDPEFGQPPRGDVLAPRKRGGKQVPNNS